jgi:outer membrane protein assembly factor BamB
MIGFRGSWLGFAVVLLATGSAQEWPRFRGPNGTGVGAVAGLPAHWNATNYRWSVRLPGPGHSSPVLWGQRLFLNCAASDGQATLTVCLDADTGRRLWRHAFPGGGYRLHRNNTFATSTPATDAQRVYVAYEHGDQATLAALDHAGKLVWEFPLHTVKFQHGLGHSPIVEGDLVLFSDDQILPGRIVALEAATGKLRWEVPRSAGRADYSTPCRYQPSTGSPWLICNTQEDGISALDPRTGRLLWQSDRVLDKRCVSSAVVADRLLISTCGSGGGGNYVVALRPPAQSGAAPEVAWQIRRSAPYVPTPLALGKLLFLWNDGGIVSCVTARSGKVLWRKRVGGNFFSSPVCADGKLFGVSTTGQVVVLAAKEQFALLGRTELGEQCHATPAIANGAIYFRTLTHVHCLPGNRAPSHTALPAHHPVSASLSTSRQKSENTPGREFSSQRERESAYAGPVT